MAWNPLFRSLHGNASKHKFALQKSDFDRKCALRCKSIFAMLCSCPRGSTLLSLFNHGSLDADVSKTASSRRTQGKTERTLTERNTKRKKATHSHPHNQAMTSPRGLELARGFQPHASAFFVVFGNLATILPIAEGSCGCL
jgi:hypothetical protein